MRIAKLAFLVRDYDEAIDWFSRCLGFELAEDIDMGGGKRWVVMQPPGAQGVALVAGEGGGRTSRRRIGKQAGGRVFLFAETDDFDRDHARMLREGVIFRETPRNEAYGKVAVFEDLYGNPWDLIEPRELARNIGALPLRRRLRLTRAHLRSFAKQETRLRGDGHAADTARASGDGLWHGRSRLARRCPKVAGAGGGKGRTRPRWRR